MLDSLSLSVACISMFDSIDCWTDSPMKFTHVMSSDALRHICSTGSKSFKTHCYPRTDHQIKIHVIIKII